MTDDSGRTPIFSESSQAENIPWSDPGFSERLLQIHLSQDNDWASRRLTVIEKQIEWIARQLPRRKSSILDLCCGPGLYTHRLAVLGHKCKGIDFSPASIAYAKKMAAIEQLDINYVLADLRSYEFTGKYDFIMMTFGEFNNFPKEDVQRIFIRASEALHDGGILMVEVYTYKEIWRIGNYPEQRSTASQGIFSGHPYYCRQSQFWDEECTTAKIEYQIVDLQNLEQRHYCSTMQAYTDTEYDNFLDTLDLFDIQKIHESEWPTGKSFSGKLQVFRSRREIFDVN